MVCLCVSVPRRGFRSLLPIENDPGAVKWDGFQSPEGDSGLCYWNKVREDISVVTPMFQSPEGDSGLCYARSVASFICRLFGFSPPKGIHCFSTIPADVPVLYVGV